MTRMSTRTHGVLDLASAAALMTLPRVLGWGERLTNTLTGVAIGTLGYSLLTNYEFGLLRVLPMRAHLGLDAASGAALCAAPALFPEEDSATHAALVGFGLFELAAALLTRPEPFADRSRYLARAFREDGGVMAEGAAEAPRLPSTSAML